MRDVRNEFPVTGRRERSPKSNQADAAVSLQNALTLEGIDATVCEVVGSVARISSDYASYLLAKKVIKERGRSGAVGIHYDEPLSLRLRL